MRIIILTDKSDRHFYFCNQIIESTNQVVGVIAGGKNIYRTIGERWKRRIKTQRLAKHFRNVVLNVIFGDYGKIVKEEKTKAEEIFFGGSKKYFMEKHQSLLLATVEPPHRSLNSDHYVNLIRSQSPDVIAVMGTCLVKSPIIDSAKCVLNLHTGLSPYYRGGATNFWPFIEEDYGYFGVTVHTMSLGIDSGDIVYTQRPDVFSNDNFATINSRCIVLGSQLMIKAINDLKNGTMFPVKQWVSGKLFYSKDMNNYKAYLYIKNKQAFLDKYCELKESNQLPELKIIQDKSKHD